ncbi:MAG: hypothetical protein ACYTXY_20890 [Nostoc sp.]
MRCLRQAAPRLRVAQLIAKNTRCCLVVVEKSDLVHICTISLMIASSISSPRSISKDAGLTDEDLY